MTQTTEEVEIDDIIEGAIMQATVYVDAQGQLGIKTNLNEINTATLLQEGCGAVLHRIRAGQPIAPEPTEEVVEGE